MLRPGPRHPRRGADRSRSGDHDRRRSASGSSSSSRSSGRSARRRTVLDPRRADGGADRSGSRSRCSGMVTRLSRRAASPASTSRTSSTRCSRSPTASRCCATAAASCTLDTAATREAEVIRAHGRPRDHRAVPAPGRHAAARCCSQVERLSAAPAKGAAPFLQDISFEVRAGEVLGIGGLMGAGRSRAADAPVRRLGRPHRRPGPAARARGRARARPGRPARGRHGPGRREDRKRYGLVLDAAIGYQPLAVQPGRRVAASA